MAQYFLIATILFMFTSCEAESAVDLCSDDDASTYCSGLNFCREKVGTNSSSDVVLLCGALLGNRQQENKEETTNLRSYYRPSSGSVWGYGVLSVSIISGMSLMGVGVLPFMSKSFYSSLLTALIGLAVGSLSGSAMFHLIPSAFNLSDVPFFAHHSYLKVSFFVWVGIYMFFVIERVLKMIMEQKSKKNGGLVVNGIERKLSKGSSMKHDDGDDDEEDPNELSNEEKDNLKNDGDDHHISFAGGCGPVVGNRELYEQSKPAMRASFGHMERPIYGENRPTVDQVSKTLEQSHSHVATVAWMIIFGDGVHNFIDGLSIGAAFSESVLTGISVSLAVLCEEFPHELGDFAVLLNSGMTMRQAMFYNFLSACTCYLGLVIGILLGELEMANQYIFALAGGMFLYISLVDMVPELNETVDEAAKTSATKGVFVFFLQNLGMLVGIVCLFVLARFQDDIQISL